MKSNNILRRIVVFLLCMAITLSYMPATFYAYAQDGEEAAAAEPKTEAVSEAPKAEAKAAEPEKKEEIKVEEKAEEKIEAAEKELVKEESAAVIESEAVQNEAKEEKAVEEVPEPVKVTPAKNISVKIHMYQMNASGEYVEAKMLTRSVSSGKSTMAITKNNANNYVTNKTINRDNNMVSEYTQIWKDASGKEVAMPYSMSYDEAAELTKDGSNVEFNLYAQYNTHKKSATITVKFEGIRETNGNVVSKETSGTISWGSSWNITKKVLESTTGLRAGQSFSCLGYRYTYKGQWRDQNGNIFDSSSSLSFMVKDGETNGNKYFITEDVTVTFTPVYEETMVQGLDCFFIDNISTGSGSWSNKGALGRSEFSSYKHTFKDPSIATPVEHFKFLYWEMDSEAKRGAEERFYDGDAYSFAIDSSLPEGTVTTVKVYAYWQPSVTVNYFVNGELVESKESFDEVIEAYGFEPEKVEGARFTGWYAGSEKDADRVAEGTAYEAPAITRDAVDPTVINLYAGFAEIKRDVPVSEKPDVPKKGNDPKPVTKVAETTTIVEEAAPAAAPAADMINIADNEAPLAQGTWALVNLIAAIVTALGAMVAIFRRKEEEDEEDMYRAEDEDDSRSKKMFAAKAAGTLAGVAAVITFLLTEDMSLPMAMIDKWTVLMVIMLTVQIVAAAFNKRVSELDDEQDAAEEAAN